MILNTDNLQTLANSAHCSRRIIGEPNYEKGWNRQPQREITSSKKNKKSDGDKYYFVWDPDG